MSSIYGNSQRYDDTAGIEYFAYQNGMGALSAILDSWKFTPFIKPSDTLLDFGCGGGWLLKQLPATRKLGVELNPAARACCKEIGIEAVASVGDLPGDLCFDVIISHHALEHVPYPIQALTELRRKLRPTGRMIIVVPLDDWRRQRDYSGTDIDHHLHTWTPRLFANTLAEAGFHAEQIDVITSAWPPHVATLHRLLPAFLFDVICYGWSIFRRLRQLRAVATPVT